jgi:hypothetical protein
VINATRGLANPEAEAGRRVFDVIKKATQEGRGPGPDELAMARRADSPLVMGDMAGEPGRALARSAANTSPEGRETLTEVVQDRFANQSARVSTFVRGLVGGNGDPASVMSALQKRARAANAPKYKAASDQAAQRMADNPDGLWTPDLAKLAESPTFAAAMRDSVPRGADRAVAAGGKPSGNPFVVAEDGTVTLAGPAKDGSRSLPTLDFWDNVKRELDAKYVSLRQAGDKSGADTVNTLRKKLVGTLDEIAPAYKEARASAASFFKAEDALEAGQNFVTMTNSADLAGARKAVAQMNATERALFAHGYAEEMAAQANRVGDNQNITIRSIFNNPLARQKAQIALGERRAGELQTFLTVERTMDRLRTALGNSTTARQLAEIGIAGGVGTVATLASGDVSNGGVAGIATILVRALSGRIDRRVAQRVAELLASDDPRQLQQAVTIITNNAGARSAMDALEGALVKIAGTAAGGEGEPPREKIAK